MRAAIYARVSTSDQNNAIQVRELKEYATIRGWHVEAIYRDTASGAKNDRCGLNGLLAFARRRAFDVVLVWKLDRFGRSTLDLLENIRELERAGVRFIATTQGIDTDQTNSIGRFTLTIIAAVAELEREMIRERTAAGSEKYKRDFAAGKARSRSGKNLPPHRPKRIFDRDEVVRLREQGLSIRAIAARVGIGEGTVSRTLQARAKSCTESNGAELWNETAKRDREAPANR